MMQYHRNLKENPEILKLRKYLAEQTYYIGVYNCVSNFIVRGGFFSTSLVTMKDILIMYHGTMQMPPDVMILKSLLQRHFAS